MRVLHVSTNYKPVRHDIGHGGVERLVLDLVRVQRSMGWDAAAVSFADSDVPLAGPVFPDDIQVTKADDRRAYDEICDRIFEQVADRLSDGRFDMVHDHMGAFAISPHAAHLPRETGLVVSCYGQRDHPHYAEIYEGISALAARSSSVIVTACSAAHRAHLAPLFRADHVIHHATSTTGPVTHEPLGYHLCMANVIPEKAQDMLVMVPELTGVPMVFTGPAGIHHGADADFHHRFFQAVTPVRLTRERPVAESLRRAMSASTRIFTGEVGDPVIREQLFRHASRLVLCNRTDEPFSLVLIEALVRGLAVVAGPFASARELRVPGATVVAELSPERVAAALAEPAPDPEVIARAARERFALAPWANRWAEVYREARARRQTRSAP